MMSIRSRWQGRHEAWLIIRRREWSA